MIKKLLATLGVIILFTTAAFSQSQIKGSVKDQSGAPLAYTRVMLKVGERVVNMATADAQGDYAMFNIEAGTYDLEVDAIMVNKKMTKAGVVVPNNQIVFENFVIDLTNDVEEVVIVWEPPVFSQDNTTSSSRLSGDNIRTTPGRSVTSALANLEGVSSVDGDMTSVRGNRSDGQQTIVDGMRVRGGNGVTMSSIEEVQLIQGGVPAEYGDGTSFMVITTKQAPKDFHGSVELRGSIDGYNNFLVAATVTGPLLKGKTRNDPTRIGFLLSGEVEYIHNYSIPRGGIWVANDDVVESIIQNPLRYNTTGFGVWEQEALHLYSESFHKERVHKFDNGWNALAQLKLDFILGQHHNMKLSISGAYEHGKGRSGWSASSILFDGDRIPIAVSNSGRVNAHFNHRVVNDTTGSAVLKNLMYDISAYYYYGKSTSYDPIHKDNIFDYGYIGQFTTTKARGYDVNYGEFQLDDSTTIYADRIYVFNGWYDSVMTFQINPNHYNNPVLSQYTLNFLDVYTPEVLSTAAGGFVPYDRVAYQQYGALLNGYGPSGIYNMYSSPGAVLSSYSKSETSQIGLKASISMNLMNHELKFGYDFDKMKYRGYGIGAYSLWTLMYNEANKHISELDLEHPIVWDNGDDIYVDYNRQIRLEDQTYFDRNLREHLGLDPNGDDWIDVDNLSPSTYSVDMFSAEELLMGTSGGNSSLVSYYGYDHTGKKYNQKTSIEDFFNNVDKTTGQKTYSIGAYEPIYMAFYIQDKFAINSLLFNVGVRVDRFDANQSVLKDPYLFREAYTVGDLRNINPNLQFVGNAQDDWVVYYSGNDVYMSEADIASGEISKQSIVGYRLGDVWYDANGGEVSNPEDALSLNVNGPILKNELDKESFTKVEAAAFTDYKAQWSVMPRISFSFPVNDNSLFYAHYNIITSRPTNLQISPVDYLFIYQRNTSVINNPNLKPQKSIDYEIGFRQKIGARSAISISAYYSEKRNQIQTYRFSGAYPTTYYSYQNIDFGTVQGFTFSYRMNRTKNLTLSANYTLQFAKGTGSSSASQLAILQAGQPNLRTLSNLSFDQRHRIGINLDYRFESGVNYDGPKSEKIKIVDGKETVKEIEWLANTGVSLLFSAASGMPYTRSSTPHSGVTGEGNSTISGSINGSNKPWQFQCDLRLDKTFMFNFNKNKKDENGKAKAAKMGYMTIYVDIQNLFNFKNIISVYDYTGNPDDDGYLSAAAYQQQINSQVDVASYIDYYQMAVKNPFNYSRPFRASLGIQFGF